ncbi:hypothetical protein NDI52_28040 [Leptolyngbya sp. PL-A3]|uniref:hypothetical protein n=1 Tax=Leptolyngbya sp. PL-A3 TaxID=2933911 RepID=UPI00329A45FC
MSKRELTELLALIDEWVEQLEDWELEGKCRQSGHNFMSFMQERGVRIKDLEAIIVAATGYRPKDLCTVDDAAMLRSAIANYEYSTTVTHETGADVSDRARHALNVTKQIWGS